MPQSCLIFSFMSSMMWTAHAGVPVAKSPRPGVHKLLSCSSHKNCRHNYFCSALATHKNQCLPCNMCKRAIDSVDRKCPVRCIPPFGSPCSKHESCKTNSEFCSVLLVKGKETAQNLARAKLKVLGKGAALKGSCQPCQYCDKAAVSITGHCPKHCMPKLGAPCDGHHHCNRFSEFCSAISTLKNKCAPCQYCTTSKDAVDHRCPVHCAPQMGSKCDAHHGCNLKTEFCGKLVHKGAKKSATPRCHACQWCQKPSDSVDGKCPVHCVPPFGTRCDGHHHCDAQSEFCSTKHKCTSCNYCVHPTDSVDHKCPRRCITQKLSPCDHHHHCSLLKGHEEFCRKSTKRCAPCQFCRHPTDSIDKTCPKHCIRSHFGRMHPQKCSAQFHCRGKTSQFCYKGHTSSINNALDPKHATLMVSGNKKSAKSFVNVCIPCQFCTNALRDAVGGKCPLTCIPALGTRCDAHSHCDATSEFCSGIWGHKNQCLSCNYCRRKQDTIDGLPCPERCIPPLGAHCDRAHPCDPLSEFCGKVSPAAKHEVCIACQYCRQKMSLTACPKHCTTPVGSHCDGHHHCDKRTEFCSKVADPGKTGEALWHKCAPCNECKSNKVSFDGKCPKHCIPPLNARCGKHEECDRQSEFCSKGAGEAGKNRCASCNFCFNPRTDSVDGVCPKHCTPPLGAPCDATHKCDERWEFCSASDAPSFPRNSCTHCHFCTSNAFAVGHKCPANCMKKRSMNGRSCNKKNWASVCLSHGVGGGEFCSAISGHEGQCMGCAYCRTGKDSATGVCPIHCAAASVVEQWTCKTHATCTEHSQWASGIDAHFCSAIKGPETLHKCLNCNWCTKGADSVTGKCPIHCAPAFNSACDGHHHCARDTEFCSKNKKCLPCQYCHFGKSSIDGRCPAHCIPVLGTHCDMHSHCDTTSEFCSTSAKHKNKCLACNYCRAQESLGGKCPQHCIPPNGAPCSKHHDCDLELEFCSILTNHRKKCVPCAFCIDGKSHAIGGHCPAQCLLHTTSYGSACRKDRHHSDCPASAFCSMIPSFEFKCLPCDACTEPNFAVDSKCPAAKCKAHAAATKAALSGAGSAADKAKYARLKAEAARWKGALTIKLNKEAAALEAAQQAESKAEKASIVLTILAGALCIAVCACGCGRQAEIKKKVDEAIKQYEANQRAKGNQYEPPGRNKEVEMNSLMAEHDEEDELEYGVGVEHAGADEDFTNLEEVEASDI